MDNPTASEPSIQVGEMLKQGRLKQRLSIAECSKRTHIAARYIEALEANRWGDLPSESHRRGFLRSYAQFLGISQEETITGYESDLRTVAPAGPKPTAHAHEKKRSASTQWSRFYPQSAGQLIVVAIALLFLMWCLYHLFGNEWTEPRNFTWTRMRTPSATPRLMVTKPVSTDQRIRIKSKTPSWIRVATDSRMLYEGILPGGAEKEWSGNGPYQIKLGNVSAVEVSWNDQPVDVTAGARGGTNMIQIPPSK